MATAAAVSAAATQVANLLAQEAKFLWGVEEEIKQLQTELQWMQSFLKEADKRQVDDERVRTWILEIRDLAYDVEDVVEIFALKIAPKRRAGCANAIKRATCILKEACELHKVKSQIEKITKSINESTRRVQTYGVKQLGDDDQTTSSSRERRREERRLYPHLLQETVVGFDDQIKTLVSVLMTEGGESQAVSIYGMGGIGKTTLAKKVYTNHQLKGRFDFFAWVYVSQQCEKKNVWASILSSLDPTFDLTGKDLRFIDPQELARRLYNFLKERRYLVVLDDVWSTQDWDSLVPGFPMQEGHEGKVLVTSRYRDVALHVDPRVYGHKMECLNDEDSWELFRKISLPARHSQDFVIHDKVEEMGKRMVECCKGLPLAISVIGGILAKKDYTYHDWKMVHDTVRSYLRQAKGITVYDSLSLSYEDLPSYLKPCFLYLAHFPEDYEIPVQPLLQMWVAEGFISAKVEEGRVVEDIAESYFIELLDRCIVQVGEQHANMRINTCRMHDLMRDFCMSKANEESFLYVIDHSHDNQGHMNILQTVASRNYSARRLALHKSYGINRMGTSHHRTLMLFKALPYDNEKDRDGFLMQKLNTAYTKNNEGTFMVFLLVMVSVMVFSWNLRRYISDMFNSFAKLRVLQIESKENVLVCNELKNVGSLIHLRYFCLTGVHVTKFPSSLGKLSCLLTLDLRNCSGRPIIKDVIWRMKQLRHLYFPEMFRCKSKLRLHNLRDLLTLVNFSTTFCQLGDIPFLTKLKELSMRGFTGYIDDFHRCIAERCCHFCENFLQEGNCSIGLDEDPMFILGKLPNLRILVIEVDAFSVEEMTCSSESFPQLDSLTLDCLSKLVDLKIAEGAMTNLYHLKIKNCQQLKMLPTGFKSTKALEKVEIEEMQEDFDNWWKN